MSAELDAQILGRLAADGHDDAPWAWTILAALDGAAALDAQL